MEVCIISMPQQARAKVRGQTEPLRAQDMSLSIVVLLGGVLVRFLT